MAGALSPLATSRYATERKVGAHRAYKPSSASHLAVHRRSAQRRQRVPAAERGDPTFEVAAKVRGGRRPPPVSRITHGAIGFTNEHALHFVTRRLWSWRAEFGAESVWAAEIGRRVAARGADALWSDLTAR
jgi:hypothetical protein